MKTASDVLREEQVKYLTSLGGKEKPSTDEEWAENLADPVFKTLIEAMKAYAQQECEKVRQDCADNAKVLYDDIPFGEALGVDKQSILQTPITLE